MKLSVDMPTGLFFEPWPDEKRREHLRETLAAAPDPDNVWVFGYGSLIWDPRFEPAETQKAILHRHRRSFCFWVTRGRGSPERPGLGLAVVPCRGSVTGIAYRIPRDEKFEDVLEALWLREMLGGVYHARWLPVSTEQGDVPAIVYVANDGHRNYCGDLSIDDRAWIMAGAEGPRGRNYEYLANLVEALETLGIDDPETRTLHDRIVDVLRTQR